MKYKYKFIRDGIVLLIKKPRVFEEPACLCVCKNGFQFVKTRMLHKIATTALSCGSSDSS